MAWYEFRRSVLKVLEYSFVIIAGFLITQAISFDGTAHLIKPENIIPATIFLMLAALADVTIRKEDNDHES